MSYDITEINFDNENEKNFIWKFLREVSRRKIISSEKIDETLKIDEFL